jgi:hypothetical protein
MTPETLEAQFRAWWAESFPAAPPPGPHAIRTHVAFALWVLSKLQQP